eukprot:6481617-Amphidinium_carterae.3
MVDTTTYDSMDATPDLALRQLFVSARLPETIRKGLADSGILTIDHVAAISESLPGFKESIQTLLGQEMLGDSAQKRLLNLVFLATVWRKCVNLSSRLDKRKVRMEEDPDKVPAIQAQDYAQMRTVFLTRHKDFILTEQREPHKKFVEKLLRDVGLHGVVPFYELGDVRLRSEHIKERKSIATTTDFLLKVAKADEPTQVISEADALNRVYAFFIGLEWVGQLAFSRFGTASSENKAGGALDYLEELERRRLDNPGLTYLITADRVIRQKVAKLLTDERNRVHSFSEALHEVLHQHQYLWNDARAIAQELTAGGVKRRREASLSSSGASAAGVKSKARRERRKKAKVGIKASVPRPPVAVAKRAPVTGAKSDRVSNERVPDNEWKTIMEVPPAKGSRICKFHNLSVGCKFGAACRQRHLRWPVASEPCDAVLPKSADIVRVGKSDTAECAHVPAAWHIESFPSFHQSGKQWFLEVFAGSANLSSAATRAGLPVLLPVDIEVSAAVPVSSDVLDDRVVANIQNWLHSEVVFHVHFGTPCTTFSRARRHDGGPPPLRSTSSPEGLASLSITQQRKVDDGNRFLDITLELIVTAHHASVHWSLENPDTSLMWLYPPLKMLFHQLDPLYVVTDMCAWQAAFRKPTKLATSLLSLSSLSRRCTHGKHAHASLTGTVTLADGQRLWRTRLAQVYPPPLCRAFVACLASSSSNSGSDGFTSSWLTSSSDRLASAMLTPGAERLSSSQTIRTSSDRLASAMLTPGAERLTSSQAIRTSSDGLASASFTPASDRLTSSQDIRTGSLASTLCTSSSARLTSSLVTSGADSIPLSSCELLFSMKALARKRQLGIEEWHGHRQEVLATYAAGA